MRKAQKSLERASPRSDCGWNLRDRNGDANIGLRQAQKSLERGSPRSDCGWNFRDRNGDANIGLRKAQIPMSLNAGNEGPQSLRGLPRSGLKPS